MPPRKGYTLPVFACAAAIAALKQLQNVSAQAVAIDLLEPAETVEIPIEQSARLQANAALAITRSDPGDNLDLTRHTPIWAQVERVADPSAPVITILGGEGIGRIVTDDRPAIYAYAQRLLDHNLRLHLQEGDRIRVTIILPEGRSLAERTSNAAFGVVEGLSLLGTSGISEPLSAPGQLEEFREELRRKAALGGLVFCIGENGLNFAESLGIAPDRLIKTANWLGPMLVEAGLQGISQILLFGYHGKLLKLAGGIFHTHHHVADGRQEILAAHAALAGLSTAEVQQVFNSLTADAALQYLQQLDRTSQSDCVKSIYAALSEQIDRRAEKYICTHSDRQVTVGSVLFNRDRQIIIESKNGSALMLNFC